jgi:hypothetical protein
LGFAYAHIFELGSAPRPNYRAPATEIALSLLGHIGEQFAGPPFRSQSDIRRVSDQFGVFGLARLFPHRGGPHGRDHS